MNTLLGVLRPVRLQLVGLAVILILLAIALGSSRLMNGSAQKPVQYGDAEKLTILKSLALTTASSTLSEQEKKEALKSLH